MTRHVEYISAAMVEVGGAAKPDAIDLGDGEQNSVACLTLGDAGNGSLIVIEGRPEQLVKIAKELHRTAVLIREATQHNPELLALYGGKLS